MVKDRTLIETDAWLVVPNEVLRITRGRGKRFLVVSYYASGVLMQDPYPQFRLYRSGVKLNTIEKAMTHRKERLAADHLVNPTGVGIFDTRRKHWVVSHLEPL
jgi:hypothetical protein